MTARNPSKRCKACVAPAGVPAADVPRRVVPLQFRRYRCHICGRVFTPTCGAQRFRSAECRGAFYCKRYGLDWATKALFQKNRREAARAKAERDSLLARLDQAHKARDAVPVEVRIVAGVRIETRGRCFGSSPRYARAELAI